MSIVQNLSGQTWNNYVQQLAKNIWGPQLVQGDSSTKYNQWQNGPVPIPNIQDLQYNQYRLLDTMTDHENVSQFVKRPISPTIDEQLTSATTDLGQVLQKKQEEEIIRKQQEELKKQKLQKTAAGFNTIGQAADFGRKGNGADGRG